MTRQRSCAEASVNPTKQVATASAHEKDNDREIRAAFLSDMASSPESAAGIFLVCTHADAILI
jgi:hypothetical protein